MNICDVASCEVQVRFRGMAGKDVARCQRGITSTAKSDAAKMNKQGGLFQGPMCRVEDKCEVPVVPSVSVDT